MSCLKNRIETNSSKSDNIDQENAKSSIVHSSQAFRFAMWHIDWAAGSYKSFNWASDEVQRRKSPWYFLTILSNAADRVREKANTDPNSDPAPSTTMIILALGVLGSFDFQGNRHIPVMQFVHSVVIRYLDSEIAGIRKSAAITCCKLVLPPGQEAPIRGDVAAPVSAVLERLLTVGIADTEAHIRSKVLASSFLILVLIHYWVKPTISVAL